MQCEEKSKCLDRMCLDGNCRPFQMFVYDKNIQVNQVNNEQPMLTMTRECACTFLCLNRPKASVKYTGTNGERYGIKSGMDLGEVSVPFELCDRNLLISRNNGSGAFEPRYEINGKCCQLGFFCKAPCESCQSIDFSIRVPRTVEDGSGGQDLENAVCNKRSAGCIQAAVGDSDHFYISWPMSNNK